MNRPSLKVATHVVAHHVKPARTWRHVAELTTCTCPEWASDFAASPLATDSEFLVNADNMTTPLSIFSRSTVAPGTASGRRLYQRTRRDSDHTEGNSPARAAPHPLRVPPSLGSFFRGAALSLACAALVACGGSEKEAKSPDEWVVAKDSEQGDGLEVTQEYGGMNQEKVDRTFRKIYPDLAQCLMDGQSRLEFLGGDVKFFLKVNLAGQAEQAHIEESTLGDYETEQCMVSVIKSRKWPKPVGGKLGKVHSSMGFDHPDDVRPPTSWAQSDIEGALEEVTDAARNCGRGGPFTFTAYVDTSGSVMAAGVAHSDDHGEATASCLLEAIRGSHFPSPGSWPAKVSFRL